jgi:hypothetical protein
MPDDTTILSLPLILPAQAQKHVTHNEALVQLDLIVQLAVFSRVLTTAPALPTVGDRYIVAAGAVGDWVGQAGRIALFSETGWQFTQPLPGWQAHVLAEGQTAVFDGLVWETLSDGPLVVAQLGVSATPDGTNRVAVSSPATLLNHAGAGHQLKLNKATGGDTASLLFQTGFSGRAEMGTAGSDDFAVKVSADGSAWSVALEAEAGTGEVTLPQPVHLGGQATDPVTPADGTLWLNTTTGEVKVRSGGVTQVLGNVGDGDKGDVTIAGGVWTIDAGAVTLGKLADMATGNFLGRDTAGTGAPEVLTPAQATALLETFTGGAKGLVPASGGGTTNFLRADGTFATPPGGGGAPGGALGEVQYNDSGALAGAADVEIEGGQLRLPLIATPATPAAGGVKLFGEDFGPGTLAFLRPDGVERLLQSDLGHFNINRWVAQVGLNAFTGEHSLNTTNIGTLTAATPAVTNLHRMMPRLDLLVSTATTSAIAGWRPNGAASRFLRVGKDANAPGGFLVRQMWGPATGVSTATNAGLLWRGGLERGPDRCRAVKPDQHRGHGLGCGGYEPSVHAQRRGWKRHQDRPWGQLSGADAGPDRGLRGAALQPEQPDPIGQLPGDPLQHHGQDRSCRSDGNGHDRSARCDHAFGGGGRDERGGHVLGRRGRGDGHSGSKGVLR